jgi:hypothetical protein
MPITNETKHVMSIRLWMNKREAKLGRRPTTDEAFKYLHYSKYRHEDPALVHRLMQKAGIQ